VGKHRGRSAKRAARPSAIAASIAALLAVLAGCIPAPNPADPSVHTAITRCWNPTPQVWLTFDDYGTAANVNGIIDVLVRNNVRARFFPIANWAQANPWLIVRMAATGQELGNHTYDHMDFSILSDAQIGWEIDHGQSGSPDKVKLIRPPDGGAAFTQRVNAIAAARDYHVCFWTVDTRDWAGESASNIIAAVRYGSSFTPPVYAGGVILMHMQAPHTLEALQGVIDAVRARGLQLAPIR
jgi:peptidoglycan/xylan/chitin deacetylase (PgdA/CDA1 family)